MRKVLYQLALTTLALALALSVSASTLAESGTKVTLQRDEFGVVFVDEWPTDEQAKAYGDYIEEKSKTLGVFTIGPWMIRPRSPIGCRNKASQRLTS